MDEAQFTSRITQSPFSGLLYKIPDPGKATLMKGGSIKRPFDLMALYEGLFFGIEVKLETIVRPFNKKRVREHQVEWLQKCNKNGGLGLLGIGYYGHPKAKKWKQVFGGEVDSLSLVPIDFFVDYEGKSLPPDVIVYEEGPIVKVRWERGYGYRLEDALEEANARYSS